MEENVKTRYSDEELEEFRQIILEKLEKAKAEYKTLRHVVMHNGGNDIEDTAPTFKTVEDDGAFQRSKEEASQLAQRQYQFIQAPLRASRTRPTASAGLPESSSPRSVSVSFRMPR